MAPVECQACNDTGLVLREQDGEWYARTCQCVKQRALDRMVRASGLCDEDRLVKLDDFKPTPLTELMYRQTQDYLDAFPELFASQVISKGLAITGTVGVGKTMLAMAVANTLLDKHIPVIFVPTPALIGELRAAQFSDNAFALEDKICALAKAQVVIFDDIAKEKATEWVQTQYYRIVDARYRRRLPTIFTSNLNFDGISDRLGDAVISRLYALTKGRQVWCEAEDYRLQVI